MKLPAPNSRVAFIGPTGSGKTFLAKKWLSLYKHVVIIDPKNQFTWGTKKDGYISKNLRQLERDMSKASKTGDPIIYRPDIQNVDPSNNLDLDTVYEMAFWRENTLVYIDELYFLASGTQGHINAPWFFRCVVAGRSRGVGVWSAYQRPTLIPLVALTETELRAIFYLRTDDDRKRLDSSFGKIAWNELQTKKHSFVLSSDAGISPVMRIKE